MSKFHFGQIVLINFPFVDSSEVKKRPALILLDTQDGDVIVSRITSQDAKSNFDAELKNWQNAGLLLPSIVRIHKIATIEKKLIEKVLGTLDKSDKIKVEKKIKDLWKFD